MSSNQKPFMNENKCTTPIVSSALFGGWREISTAPKDGTHILVWTYRDQCEIGKWDDGKYAKKPRPIHLAHDRAVGSDNNEALRAAILDASAHPSRRTKKLCDRRPKTYEKHQTKAINANRQRRFAAAACSASDTAGTTGSTAQCLHGNPRANRSTATRRPRQASRGINRPFHKSMHG